MSKIIGALHGMLHNILNCGRKQSTMFNTPDLYLGTFLIISGFALSLLNLGRIVKKNTSYSTVLLSENILLTCIGIAFVSRSVAEVTSASMETEEMVRRSADIKSAVKNEDCDFKAVLMSYGPLIVSLVNSFLSLIIDNYMHYRMLVDVKERDEDNTVREVNEGNFIMRKIKVQMIYTFFQKYFSFFAVALQWLLPLLMLLAMYPMEVKQKLLPWSNLRDIDHSCIAMLNMNNETCTYDNTYTNFTLELRKYITSPTNYLEVYESDNSNKGNSTQIDTVVSNVYKIVANLKNNTFMHMNVTSPYLFRRSKVGESCMKMCYMENKKLLLYMFLLAIASYFVPVTISTVILAKIHVMRMQKPNLKTYVSRELFYNILFWTPVMLDTFLSLILCSYSMNGVRTSLFNVVANVYQAVKNFMNTKYFKDNTIVPV